MPAAVRPIASPRSGNSASRLPPNAASIQLPGGGLYQPGLGSSSHLRHRESVTGIADRRPFGEKLEHLGRSKGSRWSLAFRSILTCKGSRRNTDEGQLWRRRALTTKADITTAVADTTAMRTGSK